MEKQTKVINKIKNSLNSGQANTALGVKNNDECYTPPAEILAELVYWAELGKFKDKKIICPCDWDITDDEEIYSITINYKPNFEVASNDVYKAVESVCYDLWSDDKEPVITRVELKEDEIEEFLKDKLTCNFLRTLTQNARAWGIKSITASGYNPANGKGVKFQDVDYSKYDICITNPPFSLYADFMNCIVDKINFIILAPFNNRNSPCVGLPLMLRKAYLGSGIEIHMEFNNPTKENGYNGTKIVNCDWIVSYPEAQMERNAKHYKSGIKYADYADEYEVMPNMVMKDGTCPIRVSMSTYPEDYDGWMFASSGVLDNLDQDTYEWYGTGFRGYFNKINPTANPFSGAVKSSILYRANGQKAFDNIVFRKKPRHE